MVGVKQDEASIQRTATLAQTALVALGVPKEVQHLPIAGAMYLEGMGAPDPTALWPTQDTGDECNDWLARQHSELSLAVTSALSLARLFGRQSDVEWQQEFDVAYLFFVKGCAQTAASIHLLTNEKCYSDAFVVLRSLHGRTNLLVLMALGPHLFDEWLKAPKEKRFLDGHVRDELANHGITTFPHFYEHASEIAHGQFLALTEAGYMESGLFPRSLAIENRVLVSAKLMFGIIGWVGLSVLRLCPRQGIGAELREHEALFRFLGEEILAANRVDHLSASIAEDRHWVPAGKNKMAIAHWFSPSEFHRQLGLFHRSSQPKRLGKQYQRRRGTPQDAA